MLEAVKELSGSTTATRPRKPIACSPSSCGEERRSELAPSTWPRRSVWPRSGARVEDGFTAVGRSSKRLRATTRSCSSSTTSTGARRRSSISSSISPTGRAARPILLVCLARPELLDVRPGWGGGKLNATSVLLEPLSEDECAELIANLVGEAELAEEVETRIAEAAEGNPLFVEEMLSMLIDDGLLVRENGRWAATRDLAAVPVPPTIQALLAARLDQLGPTNAP